MADSLLNRKSVFELSLTDPHLAREIISEMRERKTYPAWELDMMEGSVLYENRLFSEALHFYKAAYSSKKVRRTDTLALECLRSLALTYEAIPMKRELVQTTSSLLDRAKLVSNVPYQAIALFLQGKDLFNNSRTEEGYRKCAEGVRLMESVKDGWQRAVAVLRSFYSDMALFNLEMGDVERALAYTLSLEETLFHRTGDVLPAGNDDRTRKRIYAIRSDIYLKMGNPAEALSYYNKWKDIVLDDPAEGLLILGYLKDTGDYDTALAITGSYKDFLRNEEGDTMGRMIDILEEESRILEAKGDFPGMARCERERATLTYSMMNQHHNDAMDSIYEDIAIDRRVKKAQMGLYIIIGIILVVSLGAAGFINVRYSLQKKNKALVAHLSELTAYQDYVLSRGFEAPSPGARNESTGEGGEEEPARGWSEQPTRSPAAPMDEDEMLFLQMDSKIMEGKLFLQPLDRDDLARIMGVNKNRFGQIMRQYCGASNSSVYINRKRAHYAADLIRKHPNYTISAIAQDSGFGTIATFNRIFKEVFGMTPAAFRAALGEDEISLGRTEAESPRNGGSM